MGFNPRIHFLHFWRLTLESTFQKVDSSKGYFASAKLWIAAPIHRLAMIEGQRSARLAMIERLWILKTSLCHDLLAQVSR
ncbi:hypothetical protein [Helicobacter zhangjianzhongii]|uniref:hypothetical protein n=1 Tax=Helicobacter zhangjianzhongii TaxID=2974574 RepID=UPI002555884C|nr:hypothetical protein [Helicobacter sp. CPD2-1]MDL0079926.1 hypothetical protein [Helicobacter sp. CPD2-1]